MCSDFKTAYDTIITGLTNVTKQQVPKGADVIIFGYGSMGRGLAKAARDLDINVIAFFDNNYQGMCEVENIPVVVPGSIKCEPSCFVYIATMIEQFQSEMKAQLQALGVAESQIIERVTLHECTPKVFEDEHFSGYESTYDVLADEKSKQVLLQRVQSYFQPHQFEHDAFSEQYFDLGIMQLGQGDVFVDAGCFDGETSLAFIERAGQNYGYIYAFEPDPDNQRLCDANLATTPRIGLVKKGLSEAEQTLFFKAMGTGSSTVDEQGQISIDVISLDAFLEGKQHQPTFIKMDIEGSELAALRGAEQTIRKHKPKLAICVYHKIEDVYAIPELIQSYGEYTFYMRHYTPFQTETVLYALPKKEF